MRRVGGPSARPSFFARHRLDVGLRSYALSNQITPYAGATWEHEFDGKARATTNGLSIDAPSMGGDTGIVEAGLTLKPSDDLPLSIDLGLQGFVGQREASPATSRPDWRSEEGTIIAPPPHTFPTRHRLDVRRKKARGAAASITPGYFRDNVKLYDIERNTTGDREAAW